MLDTDTIRRDFPSLSQTIHGHNLIYLDNAATTQIPDCVAECIAEQYRNGPGNVHRGIHTLSARSTEQMEEARNKVRAFVGARSSDEIIFTSGTTASINMAARCLEESGLIDGDILTTEMEHHSNLIPWQQMCFRMGKTLHIVPVTPEGALDMSVFRRIMEEHRISLAAVTAASNVTGMETPVKEICDTAHAHGALVLVDGAQVIRHRTLDVQALGCDMFCFSGHKMMAPTGTGILYGKKSLLEQLTPAAFGGGMVDRVSCREASWGDIPFRFEAGTPNIVGNIALGRAIDYLTDTGIDEIGAYERELTRELEDGLRRRQKVHLLGQRGAESTIISFGIAGMHAFDIAALLDQLGIAVRSGHHCAEPFMKAMGVSGTVRVSPAFYNTKEEISCFLDAIDRICALAGG